MNSPQLNPCFQKITVADISKFEEEYKGSGEELNDLKTAYLDGEGDMEYILDNVLCCTADDEERFSGIIRELIGKGEVPDMKKFTKETTKKKKERKRRMSAEKAEAEEAAREMGLNENENSLANMIMKRQEQRQAESEGFLAHLEEKYGGREGKKKGKAKK